ncbi:hypothetical protein FA95DRAFT_1681912 [Auriscalpium vulgare]|uniref:Uncharacterized protein n=1 Tax=Auriscalpium vulgare TaxID=40419 RepID=A0ACB8RHQ1_9AGAM|nr:hypothetical protein FA95DRAFT_1681912 [Auriscalpium vulgare]
MPSQHPGALSDHEIAAKLREHGLWERKFQVQIEDLEAIAHLLLDLLISSAQSSSANTSPSTPASPSPHLPAAARPAHAHAPSHPPPYKPDQLMRLKIAMREAEHAPRSRTPLLPEGSALREQEGFLGRNDGTVRFLFGPNGGS